MQLDITTIICILTVLVSIGGFTNQKLMDDLIFYPPAISRNQSYRFFTHGFIHADVLHLLVNMMALYSFGGMLEAIFRLPCIFDTRGKLFYLLLYVTALVVASLPDYFRYKDSYHFRSLGASGAVSAVVFSTIFFFPQSPIGLVFIPQLQIPGFIFGILYLAMSIYLDKRGGGNINHSAHFWGAAYGIVFTIVFCQIFSPGFNIFDNFMMQLGSMNEVLPLKCDFEK